MRVPASLRGATLGVEHVVAVQAEVAADPVLANLDAEPGEPLGALPAVLQPDLALPGLGLGALAWGKQGGRLWDSGLGKNPHFWDDLRSLQKDLTFSIR